MYESPNRSNPRIAILVDTSGSMHGAKIRRSVFAAQQFISQLKPADHAMVVTFGPAVEVVSEFSNDSRMWDEGAKGHPTYAVPKKTSSAW